MSLLAQVEKPLEEWTREELIEMVKSLDELATTLRKTCQDLCRTLELHGIDKLEGESQLQ